MNNFSRRALTGALFVIVLIGGIWAGAWIFSLMFFLVSILALWEFYQLTGLTQHRPQYLPGVLFGGLIYTCVSLSGLGQISIKWLWLLPPAFFTIFFIELFRKNHEPSGNVALTLFGLLYIPLSFGLLSWISTYSYFPGIPMYNPYLVIGLFILIWTSDTGAYLSGKAFGKTKLFERISPGKTWEGLAGGTVLTLLVAWLLSTFDPNIRPFQWWGMAIIIQVAGTLGDLAESMLKRSVGVKDSGNVLPGHGGLLDRFDAALAVIPFVAAFLYLTI